MLHELLLTWLNNLGLNRGKSIQLALVRTENVTVLHVNKANSSVPVGYSLLVNYTSKPWLNPELGSGIIL